MSEHRLVLPGLQGNNLLGFLAALGTLRTATRALPDVGIRMAWHGASDGWVPLLHSSVALSRDDLVQGMLPALKAMAGHPALSFADDLAIDRERFAAVAAQAYAAVTCNERVFADFVAAFGCEALATDDKEPRIQDTALRTMSGAGHQHFLGFMRELVGKTQADHLCAALFEPWTYADDKPSMRWDPQDDRRYALRWKEPSGDPVATVRGANRLAIEALPLLPTAPVGRLLQTTGFLRSRRDGVLITWPIWERPVTLETARSLVSLPELQNSSPDRARLQAMGIVEVYRSERITQGKYRNFTPSFPA
jgi:hypothetical protein